jgi:hypothetical protein
VLLSASGGEASRRTLVEDAVDIPLAAVPGVVPDGETKSNGRTSRLGRPDEKQMGDKVRPGLRKTPLRDEMGTA